MYFVLFFLFSDMLSIDIVIDKADQELHFFNKIVIFILHRSSDLVNLELDFHLIDAQKTQNDILVS